MSSAQMSKFVAPVVSSQLATSSGHVTSALVDKMMSSACCPSNNKIVLKNSRTCIFCRFLEGSSKLIFAESYLEIG